MNEWMNHEDRSKSGMSMSNITEATQTLTKDADEWMNEWMIEWLIEWLNVWMN